MTNDETRKEAPNSNSHPITKNPENIFRFVNQVTGFVDLYRVLQHLSKIITDMHPKSKKNQFLYYRSQNWSLIRISEKIGVCRSTLVQWNRECEHTLSVLRAVKQDELEGQILAAHRQDLDRLIQRQNAIEEELAHRGLEEVSTEKLFRMASLVRDQVNLARVETKDLASDERYIPDDVPFFQKVLRHMRPGADALSSDNRAADEKTALDQQPPQNQPISPEKDPSESESNLETV